MFACTKTIVGEQAGTVTHVAEPKDEEVFLSLKNAPERGSTSQAGVGKLWIGIDVPLVFWLTRGKCAKVRCHLEPKR